MNMDERKEVLQLLHTLWLRYETQYQDMMIQTKQEIVPNDFFEDLYDILDGFTYDEKKLLARVMKLFWMKNTPIADKNRENWHN